MKLRDFKHELRRSLEEICADNAWSFDNSKQRGMAFEDWCFGLLQERYQSSDADSEECIIRGDDFEIDICFDSADTDEVFFVQCKHPKISASDPIPEAEVKSFFHSYELLKDKEYLSARKTKNQKVRDLSTEFSYWQEHGRRVYFVFMSTGKRHAKIEALEKSLSQKHSSEGVSFEVWDIDQLKEEYVSVKSVEEHYPETIHFQLREGHFLIPEGDYSNITFAAKGSVLKEIAVREKEKLFNWNIRRFLGKKGQVNKGLSETISKEPKLFYYYNNGISALCESFDFDPETRYLTAQKLQVVNGAQTLGALRAADDNLLQNVLVLVKLTAIKHAAREKGVAAALIRTNNTQNALRVPDFRSNDPIQIWLEQKFNETKPSGDLGKIAYGRKRPYPRSTASKTVLKMQDLAKIRFAWFYDPRIPVADPTSLFQLPDDGGRYAEAFGADGQSVELWTDTQFKETLLAVHSYFRMEQRLKAMQDRDVELKQIIRLRYYGVSLFRRYVDDRLTEETTLSREDLYAFGKKFDVMFSDAAKVIEATLKEAYKEILKREEGTAFSLPRDQKVWDLVQDKFENIRELAKQLAD